jgi:hypothetical protein
MTLKTPQRRLSHFVTEYNHIRTHEALDMKTPTHVSGFSTRPFPERIPNFDYDSMCKVTEVTQNGANR